MSKKITVKNGERFFKLKVLNFVYVKKGKRYYSCLCDCGKIKNVRGVSLVSGNTKSCGCYSHSGLRRTHGLTNTKIWKTWQNIKTRCFNKKRGCYKNYGGRGITVCEDWLKFENFYRDMNDSFEKHILLYGKKNTTIERINVNGNYCKGNCRWATYKEQRINQRVKMFLYNGVLGTEKYLSEKFNIPRSTIYYRLHCRKK